MFNFVTKNKRFAQVVLALIALPFAFFGVDYYFRGGVREGDVAKVAGEPISRAEFDNALRNRQDELRQMLGRNFDPAMFDNPEVRAAMLEQLINQKVLGLRGRDQGFRVTNSQLEQFVKDYPVFQDGGAFSYEKFQEFLRAQGLSQLAFEDRLRRDLAMAPLTEPFTAGNIVARQYVERFVELFEQQREVAVATVDAEPFLAQVKIDDAQVKSFYDGNPTSFQIPEQAKIETLVLSLDAMAAGVSVDEAKLKTQYEQNLKQYSTPEERQASHILITVKQDAKDEEKAAAKKLAEDLLAQARKAPDSFAALAKQHSQDPGSKDQGGDLGFFGRGSMVKAFEDAVFGLKVGEFAGPVQTDFGYHVIRLAQVKPEGSRPFAEVKGQIEQEFRRQEAGKKFAAAAEQFQNLVYEQADSLAGVEKALNEKGAGVKVERSDWVTRAQVQALARGNAKFAQTLFSPESLQAKRNTEAIEVGQSVLVSGRVVEHKPAAPRPFDEVKAEIARQLQQKSASEMAQKTGTEKLAQLRQGGGDAGLAFGAALAVGRNQRPPGFSDEAILQIFRADAAKLPAYVSARNEKGGFSIYRISKVVSAPVAEDKIAAQGGRVGEELSRELYNAFVATARQKVEVKLIQSNLDKK